MSKPLASDQANSIVEVENLNMFYGETQALHDIDLSIHEREVTAFIGPSAAANRRSCVASIASTIWSSPRALKARCGSAVAIFTRPIAM